MAHPEDGASRTPRSKTLAFIVVFSALIAVTTFFSIKLPAPLGEITFSPPIYMALAVMADSYPVAVAIGVGSAIGEALNVAFFPAVFLPIYVPGMVWARAPEAFIIGWARKRSQTIIVAAMVAATVFETLAFFFPDWLFYAYGVFGYGSPTDIASSFWLASLDFGTLVDLAFIPVALVIVRAARPQFRRLGFN